MTNSNSKPVLDADALDAVIAGLAKSVAESEKRGGEYSFVGIHTRGIPLAQRLAKHLGRPANIGRLDINLYRDDLSRVADMPVVKQTSIPYELEGARILLIDDVLYTGRTIRSALDALMDLGRPRKIELLVLLDRGGRELPIQADFCGKTCEVKADELIQVKFMETDGVDEVVVAKL